ncbi:MAG: substrate-binding domain-containing protein [Gammaproteobacteria bacterium WSBS_2016_MAG_OTU1]
MKLLNRSKLFFICLATALCASATAANINIVGSSTVYPFSTVAAELFALATGNKTPKVEATGTGGGLKLFCSSADAPDIANASRRIKKSEQKLCAENQRKSILEVKMGYDGIVIAQNVTAEPLALTRQQLFLALARNLHEGDKMIKNPNQKWSDIDSTLPDIAIRIYGPPPTSGTRDAFVELVMETSCVHPKLDTLSKNDKNAFCHGIREDGSYIEAGENDNLIIQKLTANPNSMGIFGFSFLEANLDKVRAASVDNVVPTFDDIANGSYSLSRPLFFYANLDNYATNKNLQSFVEFFVSPEVMGEDGVLTDRGLIPLPEDEYEELTANVHNKASMTAL